MDHPRFEKLYNFRDVGGMRTTDGRTLKTGVLFRSDALSRMSARDQATLQALNLKLICDLRAPKESQKRPAPRKIDVAVINVPLHEQPMHDRIHREVRGFLFGKSGDEEFHVLTRDYYRHLAFEQTARMREVITLLAKEESLPALFHCTAGKDRTGLVAAVIQLMVGVPYEAVLEDYLRTNDSFAPRLDKIVRFLRVLTLFRASPERVRTVLKAHPRFLDDVHAQIVERFGTIERYLSEACAIDTETVRRLKTRLLTDD